MFIIDFFKSLFMLIINFFKLLFKKKEPEQKVDNKESTQILHSEEVVNKQEESIAKEEKEEINATNENICNSNISESSDQANSVAKEKVDIEIPVESSFDPIPEEMEPSCDEEENIEIKEEKDITFTEEEIVTIKDILRPIVKSYNYEKKEIFDHYAENVKTIKCFLTAVKDSEILIFRPTQSDKYNNDIALFVRRCILKDFKDGLVAAGILDLDIECTGGKIRIRKKI